MNGATNGPTMLGDIERLLAKGPTRQALTQAIIKLQWKIEECQRFYPMQALIESWQQDIKRLDDARSLLPPSPNR